MFEMLKFKWIKMEGKIQKIGENPGVFFFFSMNCQNSHKCFFFFTANVDFKK
jgi:hypothetical protein